MVIKFMFGLHKRKTFPVRKSMKMLVAVLSVTWLGILAVNLSPDQIAQTSLIDADGNVVDTNYLLTPQDLDAIDEHSEEWNASDARFQARSLAENGIVAFHQGDFENAIDLYNRSLELGAFDAENQVILLGNLALAYESYGDTTHALSTYARMLELIPENTAMHYVISGKILLVDEFINVNAAIEAFESALTIDPENFDANNTLALIYMGEYGDEYTDFTRALPYNEKSQLLKAQNPNVMLNMSINYIGLEQYNDATIVLAEVLESLPHSLPANYLMMRATYLDGDIATAEEYAVQLAEWNPGFKNDKLVAEILESQ